MTWPKCILWKYIGESLIRLKLLCCIYLRLTRLCDCIYPSFAISFHSLSSCLPLTAWTDWIISTSSLNVTSEVEIGKCQNPPGLFWKGWSSRRRSVMIDLAQVSRVDIVQHVSSFTELHSFNCQITIFVTNTTNIFMEKNCVEKKWQISGTNGQITLQCTVSLV